MALWEKCLNKLRTPLLATTYAHHHPLYTNRGALSNSQHAVVAHVVTYPVVTTSVVRFGVARATEVATTGNALSEACPKSRKDGSWSPINRRQGVGSARFFRHALKGYLLDTAGCAILMTAWSPLAESGRDYASDVLSGESNRTLSKGGHSSSPIHSSPDSVEAPPILPLRRVP